VLSGQALENRLRTIITTSQPATGRHDERPEGEETRRTTERGKRPEEEPHREEE
jgi:hypothetical protein